MTAVAVEGASDSPSTILLAAWLTLALDAPVTIVADPAGTGIRRVRLTRTAATSSSSGRASPWRN